MANLRVLWNNLATAAASVASASASASALPPANAQTIDRTAVWRSSTTTGDQWLRIDFGSALTVTAIAIANPKLHTGGTMKVQYSSDGASWTDAAPTAAFPTMDADTKVTYLFITSISRRYWRILFTNTGAVSDYVELGYLFVGTYFEPANNVVSPFITPIHDPSIVARSITGQRSTTVRPQASKGTFNFEDAVEADRSSWQQIFRTLGIAIPFFAVLDLNLSWTAWLLFFDGDISRTFKSVDTFYDLGIAWEEAL